MRTSATSTDAPDRVYLAYAVPYSYTDLQRYLCDLPKIQPKLSTFCIPQVLCHTLGDNQCPLLTITALGERPAVPIAQRPVVFISGRVHPGETAGSWMVKGLLDFLTTEDDPDARWLRDRVVFKVIPMLNPDGVANGNSRCSLSATDLNRQWAECTRQKHPTVWWLKNYMRHVRRTERRNVLLFCDFHGHSRMKNVFMFGCRGASNQPEEVLPGILAKRLPYFSLASCSYKMHKTKASTGRIVAFQELGIALSYTLEASLCGGTGLRPDPDGTPSSPTATRPAAHFNTSHYCRVGHFFALAVRSLVTCQVDGTSFLELVQTSRVPTGPSRPEGDPENDDPDSAE